MKVLAQGLPSPTATITPFGIPVQQATLIPLAPGENDNFGNVVAINAGTIAVGSPDHDLLGLSDAGAAYIYVFNGTIWIQQAKLTASDAASNDHFGYSVAVFGNTVVVGAHGDDDSGGDSGSVYVFVRDGSTWSEQTKLTASDADASDSFGWSVSMSVETVVVGASGDDENKGAAYVFVRSGDDWSQQQKLIGSDITINSRFGHAVDIYDNTIMVGAPQDSTHTGAVYAYTRSGGVWSQQQKLSSTTGGVGSGFGSAVAVYDNQVIVGAPFFDLNAISDAGKFYIFARTGSTWSAIPDYFPGGGDANDQAGYAVDIFREMRLSSAPYAFQFNSGLNTGMAYLMSYQPWEFSSYLATEGSLFGWSVARDEMLLVIGAPRDDYAGFDDPGVAYVFSVSGPPWVTASPTPSPVVTNTLIPPSPTLTPSNTPFPTNTPQTPTSLPNSTPGSHFFAVRHPTLTWDNITWALGYHIEIDDDPAFASPISGETDANTLSYTTVDELDDGVYYWRVRAKQNDIDWGDWSATETIIVSVP